MTAILPDQHYWELQIPKCLQLCALLKGLQLSQTPIILQLADTRRWQQSSATSGRLHHPDISMDAMEPGSRALAARAHLKQTGTEDTGLDRLDGRQQGKLDSSVSASEVMRRNVTCEKHTGLYLLPYPLVTHPKAWLTFLSRLFRLSFLHADWGNIT